MAALSITAANMIPVAAPTNNQVNVFEYGPAGATITQGQAVYWDPTALTYGLFDADSVTAAIHTLRGIAVSSAVAGQQVAVQTAGQLAFGAILTKGLIYVGGATPGQINPSADLTTLWYINALGYAISTSVLELAIKNTLVAI